ncbi:MAG TPA: type II toxin-antitoxin system prevent-host-death family antitoxin, partial [Trueperaceae bacterium]|nr:type II toxin-antitoxin system prevent-host-death family antitoxin [Trueperaceae bacterium]
MSRVAFKLDILYTFSVHLIWELTMNSATISVKEARRNFAKILKSAENGEETIITKNGKVVARILPPKKRQVLDLDELRKFRE